jgi:hypothetical protein
MVRKTRDLGRASFAEALMEDLAAGIRREHGASHPSSRPRRALNRFRWQPPTSLPTSGGPSVLTGEAHSFSRVFTGCFYDVIRGIFRASSKRNANALRDAADTAGRLLIQGTRAAVEQLRFYRAVGEAMLQADIQSNRGAHQKILMDAFEDHGIPLALPARAFSVRSALTSSAPRRPGRAGRGGCAGSDSPARVPARGGHRDQEAARGRPRPARLPRARSRPPPRTRRRSAFSARCRSPASASACPASWPWRPQSVVVSRQGRATMLRSAIPTANVTDEESRFFVATLLQRGSIAFNDGGPPRTAAVRGPARAAAATPSRNTMTHAVKKQGKKRVLVRLRFTVCCGHRPARRR